MLQALLGSLAYDPEAGVAADHTRSFRFRADGDGPDVICDTRAIPFLRDKDTRTWLRLSVRKNEISGGGASVLRGTGTAPIFRAPRNTATNSRPSAFRNVEILALTHSEKPRLSGLDSVYHKCIKEHRN